MGIYINPTENIYPRHDGDIKLIDPTWEEGTQLPDGWEQVEPNDPPAEWKENWIEIAPIKVDGHWKRAFEYVEPEVI